MGAIPSTLQLGLTYCCCNSLGSLCTTCLGSSPDDKTTGRKRSVFLLLITIAVALYFQYGLSAQILSDDISWWNYYRKIPGLGKRLFYCLTDSCDQYKNDSDDDSESNDPSDLYMQCVSNAGVYRPTFLSTIFFLVNAAATKNNPSLNKQAWPAKYGIYFCALLITLFIPNQPFFSGFYLILMRCFAMVFILIQQVILIDMAYNWNESWLTKSEEADYLDYGSGLKWIQAILWISISLYMASAIAIGFLYHYFSSCGENIFIITWTVFGIIGITAVQLMGDEGSILTTGVMSTYSVYLAYSMLSKNPNGVCNPTLGDNDVWGITVGLLLTIASLIWTGWSWTAEERLNIDGVETTRAMATTNPNRDGEIDLDTPFLDPEDEPTSGNVMVQDHEDSTSSETSGKGLWKLNIILALISCWVAALLTGWGSLEGSVGENGQHTAANPTTGRVNMAMIGISQSLALLLYAWTLVAPKLFPDREF